MLGLPGDFTSPSRFVRAAFFQTTAPVLDTGFDTVVQAFHILDNFDIPIGSQHAQADIPKGLPSATQFTAATDQTAMKLYYRTAWNSNIRCIDLMSINFHNVKYQSHPLDTVTVQPVELVKVK
jgi:choloylglycine hydrolase